MAYNDTPLATETPSNSQPLMRQNFQQIAISYNTDHVPLSSGVNVGFSNKLTLVDQTSGPGSAASQVVEYAKSVIYPNAAGTFSELFFERDASGTEVQMTTGPGDPIAASTGQTYLPGGMILKWGQDSVAIGSNQTVPFTQGAFPTNCFAVVVSGRNAGNTPGSFNVNAVSRTDFTIYCNVTGNIYYFAIGN